MPSPSASFSRAWILLIGMLIIAGAFARLYDPERMVVWHDEVFSLLRTYGFDATQVRAEVFSGRDLSPTDLLAYQRPAPDKGWDATFASLATHPEHGPLFFLSARLLTPAFPSPLAAVRSVSALLSLLLIPGLFWLARELFRDSKSAWLAAALAATSPMHLLYAQEARQYALWTAIAAAASAALLRALRRGRTGDWLLYAFLSAAGLYTHLLFGLVLAAHALFVITQSRQAPLLFVAWMKAAALSVLLFGPWLWVLASRWTQVEEVTAWMQRPVGTARILEAWGLNLIRMFADFPAAGAMMVWTLPLLAWVLWRFFRHAPTAPRLFLGILLLVFSAAVLIPDLTGGGSRSLHPRYLLPAFLALQLAVAYVAASGWNGTSAGQRLGARALLLLATGPAVISGALILQADTWWNKNFSARNHEVAALVNGAERPLVVATDSSVGLGEIVSLAYALDDRAIIRGAPMGGNGIAVDGFGDLLLLTPSEAIRAALGTGYRIVPVPDTWQWYSALPNHRTEN